MEFPNDIPDFLCNVTFGTVSRFTPEGYREMSKMTKNEDRPQTYLRTTPSQS